MKNLTLSLITLVAAASAHASVTANCTDIRMIFGEQLNGNPTTLISADGTRLSFSGTRERSSRYEYSTRLTLFNPLLATGLFQHMEIRLVARTNRTEIPVQVWAIKPIGGPELIATRSMATSDRTYRNALRGNVGRFILPGGKVQIHLFAHSAQPFRHTYDQVSVTFF